MDENVNVDKMRRDIYQQLKAKYTEDPDSLSDGVKAILAMLATTLYMDDYDAWGDILADMGRRVEAAEKLMDEVESGTYRGVGDPIRIVDLLVPLEMAETAEAYTGLWEMAVRMWKVIGRSTDWTIHEYEREHGLPLSDFRHPMDVAEEEAFANLPDEDVDIEELLGDDDDED